MLFVIYIQDFEFLEDAENNKQTNKQRNEYIQISIISTMLQ